MPNTHQSKMLQSKRNKVPSHYQSLAQNGNLVSISNETYQENLRYQKLLAYLLGNEVQITLKNGSCFEGILDSINLETGQYTLKYVKSVPRESFGNRHPIANWNVLFKDVACIACINFNLKAQVDFYASNAATNAAKSAKAGFQTDTSISKASGPAKERKLEMWSDDVPDNESFSLNYGSNKAGGDWDQFAANEKKFGVKTDFDENLYTTVLDKSGPDYQKKAQEAARLAREIESGSASNHHVAEERGQKVHGKDVDEEAIYSSVARDKQPAYNANLKLFDQLTSKAKVRPDATAIRKASIDQLGAGKHVKPVTLSSALKSGSTNQQQAASFDKASLAQSAEKFSAILAKQPIDDLKRKFKPFANDIKSHLTERKQTILKEGRKVVIEEFKSFATGFKMPDFVEKSNSAKSSPKSATGSIKADVEAAADSSADPSGSQSKKTPVVEIVSSAISEAGSQDTSTTASTAAKTFKLSAAAVEFTPSGYPPAATAVSPYKNNRGGGSGGTKRPYHNNKGNNPYYNNNPGYYPPDPSMYGGGQFYPQQQQFMPPPPRGYMPQMYYPPIYPPHVGYAPNGPPMMNQGPPYMNMINPGWYPGMEMPPGKEGEEIVDEDAQREGDAMEENVDEN